eukprot:3936933-Prymnesium_polylepis.1
MRDAARGPPAVVRCARQAEEQRGAPAAARGGDIDVPRRDGETALPLHQSRAAAPHGGRAHRARRHREGALSRQGSGGALAPRGDGA